jgi:hypothetical protein
MELTNFQQELIPARFNKKIEAPRGIIYTYTKWGYPTAKFLYDTYVSELDFNTEEQLQKWIEEEMQKGAA